MKKTLLIGLILLAGCSAGNSEKKTRIPLKNSLVVWTEFQNESELMSESFACRPIIDAFVGRDPDNFSKGVSAEVSKPDGTYSVQIADKVLYFQTSANLEVGKAKPAVFEILVNNDHEIVAGLFEQPVGTQINTFILNKQNGFGTFVKNSSHFFITGMPHAEVVYLQCEESILNE